MTMKSVLALSFAAAASAEVLAIGYGLGSGDLEMDVDANKGAIYEFGPFQVDRWMIDAAGTGSNQWLNVDFTNTLCVPCLDAKLDVRWAFGATKPGATGNLAQKDMTVNMPYEDVRFGISPTASVPLTSGTGMYWVRVNATCSGCSSSMEMGRVEVSIMNSITNMHGGYPYQEDRNADRFNSQRGKWGPLVRYKESDNSNAVGMGDFIVIQYEMATLSIKPGVVHYIAPNATSHDALASAWDPTTHTCAMSSAGCSTVQSFNARSDFMRAPSLTYDTGEIPAERLQVTMNAPGTGPASGWFARALGTKGSGKVNVAVGLNRVPAAAPGVLPNAIALAILGLFAFLR